MQNVVEDRPDEQDAERIEQADAGRQNHGGKSLEHIPACIVDQTPEALHARSTPRNGR